MTNQSFIEPVKPNSWASTPVADDSQEIRDVHGAVAVGVGRAWGIRARQRRSRASTPAADDREKVRDVDDIIKVHIGIAGCEVDAHEDLVKRGTRAVDQNRREIQQFVVGQVAVVVVERADVRVVVVEAVAVEIDRIALARHDGGAVKHEHGVEVGVGEVGRAADDVVADAVAANPEEAVGEQRVIEDLGVGVRDRVVGGDEDHAIAHDPVFAIHVAAGDVCIAVGLHVSGVGRIGHNGKR